MHVKYYTARVELYEATSEDYEKLHLEMYKNGFSRTIVSDDGREANLPDGLYYSKGTFDIHTALSKSLNAAAVTGKRNAVVVSGDNLVKWEGLSKVIK